MREKIKRTALKMLVGLYATAGVTSMVILAYALIHHTREFIAAISIIVGAALITIVWMLLYEGGKKWLNL